MLKNTLSLILTFTALLLFYCAERETSKPVTNLPPETHLFITDTTVNNMTTSVQNVFWWGNDPDGEVIGYYYRWFYENQDTLVMDWTYTDMESDTFYLPLREETGTFRFEVKAIDNDSVQDPSPAYVSIPVMNSPPEIEFRLNSNPPEGTIETSFTTRSFYWEGTDIDGLETIVNYFYALDDTSEWIELPGWQTNITMENLIPGNHVFYLKARDIANAESEVVSYPGEEGEWIVQEPVGSILIIDDYEKEYKNDGRNFYTDYLENNLNMAGNYSIWDIATNLPYAREDIKATMNFFDVIIWYGDSKPQFNKTASVIQAYIDSGKKILLNSVAIRDVDTDSLYSFLPLDTILVEQIARIMPNEILNSMADDIPDLVVSKLISYANGFTVKAVAEPIYQLGEGSFWEGTPQIAFRYPIERKNFYFLNFNLHKCELEGAHQLLDRFYNGE